MSRILYLITIHKKSIALFTLSFIIIFFELFSIHYNYSGPVATVTGQQIVTHDTYPYPYYSDEWVGVSLTKYAIENHALPMTNPLDSNKFFANPLVVFYSLTALIFGITGIDPLIGWTLFALINGLTMCIMIYFISRRLGVSVFASSVAMLAVPLITNGTNAPGIWFFVPFLASLSVFLIAILLTLTKKICWALAVYTFSLIIYPPMVLFILPAIAVTVLQNKINQIKTLCLAVCGVIFGSGFISIFFIHTYGWSGTLHLLISWIIRPNLDGGIPFLSIWNMVPIPILLLVCIGIVIAVQRKIFPLLLPVIVGLIMWIIYAYIPQTCIIDYSRIVAITSILLMLFVGLGTDVCLTYISRWHRHIKNTLMVAILLCFCVIAFSYPSHNSWSKLTLPLKSGTDIVIVHPANPINRYLNPIDLKLFNGIYEHYFISQPWKGLVIGVATHNYPLESKSSTIGNEIVSYNDFISADCTTKTDIASRSQLTYAYTQAFNCPQFIKIGENTPENMNLYQYEQQ